MIQSSVVMVCRSIRERRTLEPTPGAPSTQSIIKMVVVTTTTLPPKSLSTQFCFRGPRIAAIHVPKQRIRSIVVALGWGDGDGFRKHNSLPDPSLKISPVLGTSER